MIFTTNKPLAAGGASCTTPTSPKPSSTACSNAGRHLELRGRSYRTRHAPLDLTPASEPPSPGPAESGNHRPEFSEPTRASGAPARLRAWSLDLRAGDRGATMIAHFSLRVG